MKIAPGLKGSFKTLICGVAVAGLAATAACSTSAGSEPDSAGLDGAPLTQERFLELLAVSEVEEMATGAPRLTAQLRDLRSMAESVDPGRVVAIESWYGNTFVAQDGAGSLTFTVIDFVSSTAAEDHFTRLSAGSPAPEPVDPPIGDASVALSAESGGVGATLTFRSDDKIATLHTTISQGSTPLLGLQDLEGLARSVEGRLR